MRRQRFLDWQAAMRDLRADRATRPDIREERLRPAAGLRGNPPIALSAWRGLSGRRYVVAVTALDADAPGRVGDALAIAVRRDADGRAAIVAIAGDTSRPSWWARARNADATELHLYRLAANAGERAAVMMDLLA